MREGKVGVSLIYNSLVFLFIKIILFFIFLGWLIYSIAYGLNIAVPLFVLSLALIIHIFIKFELEEIFPSKSIRENPENLLDCFTKEALISVLFKKNTKSIISYLLNSKGGRFYLEKCAIDKNSFEIVEFTKEELFNKAFQIASSQSGKYITSSDLLTSYFLITENQTKLLFANKLKEDDILNINHWARISFKEEEIKKRRVRFIGIGIGETLVWGWTPETKNYTKDITFSNIRKRSYIEGREDQYGVMLEALQKNSDNNVLLVGNIGVGKTTLVENFIFDSYESNLNKKLNHRRFLEISVGSLVAGTQNREELEVRLQAIIEEVKHSGNIILFIPEFQNLLGSSSYGVNLSGAILPYLKDGKMPIIATMTNGEYKNYFEKNSLREVFEIIKLEEPDSNEALKMILQKSEDIEEKYKIKLSYKSIRTAIFYADKFDLAASLPGTAVELLEETANSIRLSNRKNKIVLEEDVLSKVRDRSHIPVGSPTQEEKSLLLNLEKEMHRFVIGQDQAIKSISQAIRRIRVGLTREKPISFLFLGPTGVGKTETAKSISKIYFGGEEKIVRVDMSEYGSPDSVGRFLENSSGSFLDQVLNHQFCLILLDEFEKANEKIIDLFLQVLDDGRMTDSSGRTISFTNAIIIATSNAGSELIRESLRSNSSLSNQVLLDFLQKNALFKPELLNRFDDIVIFNPLSSSQISEITNLMLQKLISKLKEQDIALNFSPSAIEVISKGGFDEEFGARPLARFIQDKVEDEIAKKMLSGEIVRGDSINISVDQNSTLIFTKN